MCLTGQERRAEKVAHRGPAGRPVDSTRAITAAWARGQAVAGHGHELVADRIELVPRPGDDPFAAVHSAAGCWPANASGSVRLMSDAPAVAKV